MRSQEICRTTPHQRIDSLGRKWVIFAAFGRPFDPIRAEFPRPVAYALYWSTPAYALMPRGGIIWCRSTCLPGRQGAGIPPGRARCTAGSSCELWRSPLSRFLTQPPGQPFRRAYGSWMREWLWKSTAVMACYAGGFFGCRIPRDPQGELDRDKNNPDPALRQRPLCGLTILWDLRPAGPERWQGGWFYNPDDGKTYSVSAQLKSADLLIARIYRGIPLFGETKTLTRVPHGTSKGWC